MQGSHEVTVPRIDEKTKRAMKDMAVIHWLVYHPEFYDKQWEEIEQAYNTYEDSN